VLSEQTSIRLPHNPAYTPIPGDSATILGKVVAVLRRV
jgi:repressor LexA